MAKRKPDASALGRAAVAGILYLTAGAALAVGGFFTPHSLAREAAMVSGTQAPDGHPLKVLVTTAHHVVMTGHVALTASLHLAMVTVHACLHIVSALFGI
jgi:hypothetical protein